jgi:WD40 repeat protein
VIWDTTAPKPNLRLPVWAWAVLFSADGRWLITADRRTAQIWDTTTGKRLLSVTHRSSCDHAVALTPDSRWLATSSPDHSVRIWGTADGQALMTISVDPNPPLTVPGGVDGLAFSPDGRWLATASTDKTARIWDAATGQMLAQLPHDKAVRNVAFGPDGDRLATATKRSAQIWELYEGGRSTTR